MEATGSTVRALVRDETPARLRLWSALVMLAAAALLVSTSVVLARVRDQVRIIGREAAPQAATAADLYLALSDMDAQVTRLLLTGDSDALAGTRVDALGAYRQRSRQVDEDLQRSLTTASGPADRAVALDLMTGLAVYRQRIGQTLTAREQGGGAGRLPPGALGYYTQATNVLHLRLLPAAQRLRDAATDRLDRAYAGKSATESAGLTLAVLFGGSLLVLLIVLQVWLSRRFRRSWNPALLGATALSLLLVPASVLVLSIQSGRMSEARSEGLDPYLALSRLRAVGYDAAADTSRYLVSGNLSRYRDDFTAKSGALAGRDGLRDLAGPEALTRWEAYRRDHLKVLQLADARKGGAAVTALTGIRRGDAAFDFAYFDASMGAVTDVRKSDFDRGSRAAERTLRGGVTVPIVVLGLVIALVPIGVRRRLAEYR